MGSAPLIFSLRHRRFSRRLWKGLLVEGPVRGNVLDILIPQGMRGNRQVVMSFAHFFDHGLGRSGRHVVDLGNILLGRGGSIR